MGVRWWQGLPWFIGLRYVRFRGGGSLGSFISALAMIGMVMGVALLIIVMSVMNGFDRELRQHILRLVPHVQLLRSEGIIDPAALIEFVESEPDVIEAYPETSLKGMIYHRQKALPMQLVGLDFASAMPSGLSAILTNKPPPQAGQVLIAEHLAKASAIVPGDTITLILPGKASAAGGGGGVQSNAKPQAVSVVVAGLFATHTQLDQLLVLAPLAEVNRYAGVVGAATVSVQLEDLFEARNAGYRMIGQLPAGYAFRDWFQSYSGLYQSIQLSRNMVSLLVFLVVAIAAFNVISMMMMSVLDKRASIAILKTLGMRTGAVMGVFWVQGTLIGLVGVVVGVALGLMGTLIVPHLLGVIEYLVGAQLLNIEIYPIDYLPVDVRLPDVALICAAALVLNFFAAAYPAWRASRVAPAEELRYE